MLPRYDPITESYGAGHATQVREVYRGGSAHTMYSEPFGKFGKLHLKPIAGFTSADASGSGILSAFSL